MTKREINEKISAWIGRPCTCVTELDSDNLLNGIPQYTTYWGNCAMHSLGGRPTPYVTSDRCASELLTICAERGYAPYLYHKAGLWTCGLNGDVPGYLGLGIKPTMAEAICQAVTSLIDRLSDSR